MYREFTGDLNLQFLERAVVEHTQYQRLGLPPGVSGFWVVYGSFILNSQTARSDVDCLFIHTAQQAPARVQSHFEGRPVTIYTINRNDFANDGIDRRYGGYFAGKPLNPHVIFSSKPEDRDLVLRTAGGFIAPFAAYVSRRGQGFQARAGNILADTVQARFRLCPWYKSYFLRYVVHPEFPALWEHMKEVVLRGLTLSGMVVPNATGSHFKYADDALVLLHKHGNRIAEYCTSIDGELVEQFFEIEIIRMAGLFWSMGACLHGGQPDFLSRYRAAALSYVNASDLHRRSIELSDFMLRESLTR